MTRKHSSLVVGAIVALAVGFASYMFVVGVSANTPPAMAHSSTMPTQPHIIYLAPEGIVHGVVSDQVMQTHGAVVARGWQVATRAGQSRPIDALIVDTSMVDKMTPANEAWLKAQFQSGVVVVGLGTDASMLSQRLGFSLDANRIRPLTSSKDYIMLQSLQLAHPEDLETLEKANWVQMQANGEDMGELSILHPAKLTSGWARGQFESDAEVDVFFLNLNAFIEGVYQARADYQQSLAGEER